MTLFCALPTTKFTKTDKTEVTGKFYEFGQDSHYEFEEADNAHVAAPEKYIRYVLFQWQ